MSLDHGSELTMRGGGMRTRLVSIGLLLVFGVIAVKGLTVALTGPEAATTMATSFDEAPRRADIVDRNGDLLATSVTVYSVFADPRAIGDAQLIATWPCMHCCLPMAWPRTVHDWPHGGSTMRIST